MMQGLRVLMVPTEVTEFVLNQLQLPQDCTDKFKELQAAKHSVRLECPRCAFSSLIIVSTLTAASQLQGV